MQQIQRPTIALTLGDAAGIGAELIAKLIDKIKDTSDAHVILVGDTWLWEQGQKLASTHIELPIIDSFEDAKKQPDVYFLPVQSIDAALVHHGEVNAACGKAVLDVLRLCLDAAKNNEIDAICFAPLNKNAMKLGGLNFDDELHFFADYLGVDGYFCEFNTLGSIWTSRISSHIPLKDVSQWVTQERILAASKLMYSSLQNAGIAQPRIAVAAFNPHGGDGGLCGREEVETIIPAVQELNKQGYPIAGPFPADTIFLKVRDGHYDAVVTMYHDQGQIAIKLLGFEKGVTVQGGLPVPITTPAHGTAFDIAGQGKANVEATYQAYQIAKRMANTVVLNRT
ncbi:4-hydroxythreonine-4-phosphate dehydrogenase PdxA [uncultured Acinetobacter sp.]|uniref:4-hydroxythreonine-4-phosphate dehydrogenase PdxA n=1 Tax=uncultured Acinetobacter sp. TaxID=165433 RepID=UPI0028D1BD54